MWLTNGEIGTPRPLKVRNLESRPSPSNQVRKKEMRPAPCKQRQKAHLALSPVSATRPGPRKTPCHLLLTFASAEARSSGGWLSQAMRNHVRAPGTQATQSHLAPYLLELKSGEHFKPGALGHEAGHGSPSRPLENFRHHPETWTTTNLLSAG